MKPILKPITIFSVYQSGLDVGINQREHERTLDLLRRNGIRHMELDGVYKGQHERSILIEHGENEHEERILIHAIAEKYNQESVLYTNELRQGVLIYTRTLETTNIGVLRLIGDGEKLPDSYSVTKDGLRYTFN